MDMTGGPGPRRQNMGQVMVGIVVLGIGIILLADRYLDTDVRLVHSWWPLILILMGAARLVALPPQPERRAGCRRSGVWLIMVGLWALVSDSHLFGFTFATSWPLLLIGAGVLMVWRALETGSRQPVRREP
jgi:LiaI-LiaF-like transmembrane region